MFSTNGQQLSCAFTITDVFGAAASRLEIGANKYGIILELIQALCGTWLCQQDSPKHVKSPMEKYSTLYATVLVSV